MASFILLAWGAGSADLASSFVDPVGHVLAQDEALYAASSLQMARHGGWLTPIFLDRPALYKPPLIYWLSAISVKLVGATAFAIRLPSLLAGAATVAAVFAGVRSFLPLETALAASLLLFSSHLFFVLSRTGLTDAPLLASITIAIVAAVRDPRLEAPVSRWICGAAAGLAILTKAAAGLLPIIILAIGGVPLLRVAQIALIATAVAAPWHVWQFHEHPRWFWAEYFLGEHVAWGFAAPHQTTQEPQALFYAKRLAMLDPALLIVGAIGAFRARSRLLISWIGVILASVLAWQYRNVAYLLPLYPALAIAAGFALPKRASRIALGVSVCILLAKLALPSQPWGMPLRPESVNPSRRALDEYAKRKRGNELIIVEPNDEFYAACLDLPHVRYLWIDPSTHPRLPLDFESLGITVSASDFERIDQLRSQFAARLREWNVDTDAPVATVILARSAEELRALIASHPRADFFVPSGMGSSVHDLAPAGARKFLLSREMIQRP